MGNSYLSKFYSDGFFGFGEEGDFQYWSLAHFLPILLTVALIYLIFRYRAFFRTWKHEENFRFFMGGAMLLVEMSYFWRLLYVGSSDPGEVIDLMDKLPLQVCEWSCIFASFMMMKKSENIYQICFFVCLSAGLFPLLTPAVITKTGPAYYRYYQYWLEHLLPIIGLFYMTFVHGFRARFHGVFYAVAFLGVLAVFAVICNLNIPGANYLYLVTEPDTPTIADVLPNSIGIRLLIFAAVIFTLFFTIYAISRFFEKRADAQKNTENV